MQVVILTSCATKLEGRAIGFARGQSYDLPERVAQKLIDAGYAKPSGKAAKQKSAGTSEKSGTSTTESTEQSKPLEKQTKKELQATAAALGLDTKGTNKQLVARIRSHKESAPEDKAVGPAPENK